VTEVRSQLITVISSPAARSASQPRVGRDGKKRRPSVKTQQAKPPKQPPDQLPKQQPLPPPQEVVEERGVFCDLRKVFDAMTVDQRFQASLMWAGWIEDAA
jgi:hypothetical protein